MSEGLYGRVLSPSPVCCATSERFPLSFAMLWCLGVTPGPVDLEGVWW